MWLVARIDDRARRGGGAGDFLADVLRPLREAVVEAARGLEYLARAGEDLPRDEEGDEPLGQALERHVAADQVVLVAAVGVARRVRVVLEEQNVARDRSEEHTSELQSQSNLVCRLLLEKQKQ